MQLTGIHHLTAVTAHASRNHDFYTRILGMRMVKKTVNQDDVSAYHLFYADGEGSPGTDITFFDFPTLPEKRGTNSIVRTALRISGQDSFDYWAQRLDAHNVERGPAEELDGRMTILFEDFEGQPNFQPAEDQAGQGARADPDPDRSALDRTQPRALLVADRNRAFLQLSVQKGEGPTLQRIGLGRVDVEEVACRRAPGPFPGRAIRQVRRRVHPILRS